MMRVYKTEQLNEECFILKNCVDHQFFCHKNIAVPVSNGRLNKLRNGQIGMNLVFMRPELPVFYIVVNDREKLFLHQQPYIVYPFDFEEDIFFSIDKIKRITNFTD